jgi:fructose/tagatose bisphosphate aldolase
MRSKRGRLRQVDSRLAPPVVSSKPHGSAREDAEDSARPVPSSIMYDSSALLADNGTFRKGVDVFM